MSALSLAVIDQAEARLSTIRTIEEAKALRDTAEAFRIYAKGAREGLVSQNRAAYIKIMAERKAGELIAKLERVQNRKAGANGKGICSTLEQLGIPRNTAYRWQTMAKVPDARVKLMHAQANAQHEELTSAGVYSVGQYEIRREEVRQHLDDPKTIKAKEIEGVYDVAVYDMPWQTDAGQKYRTMSKDEIIAEAPRPFAENCLVFLWTTQPHLFDAGDIVRAWELDCKCLFTWHKDGGIQPTGYPRYNSEFVLYATKGSPQFVDTKSFDTCFFAPRGEHSEKPEEFYETLRRVTAGRRIDIYNRREIAGFDGWGDESPDVGATVQRVEPLDGTR